MITLENINKTFYTKEVETRALIGESKVILADEPTGNLDSKVGAESMDIMIRLNREGTTIVMVIHDEKLVRETGRIVRLFDGKLVL